MEGKTIQAHLHIKEHLIFNMHDIHAGDTIRKEYINLSHERIIHILFYEQAECKKGTK